MILLYTGLAFSQSNGNKLVVSIKGLESNEGFVRIALCNSRESWEGSKDIYKGSMSAIKNNTSTCEFTEIPFGEYALRVYHDENSNNKLDTNFMGIPKEDYGFSNNATVTFSMPDYDRVKFNFNKNAQVITINVD